MNEVLSDIRKLNTSNKAFKFILVVVFPFKDSNVRSWNKQDKKIEKALNVSRLNPKYFTFQNGISGIIYCERVNPA